MDVRVSPAPPHFAGFNEKEGLSPSNSFICPVCKTGVSFPPRVLDAAREARFNNTQGKSKLKPEVAPLFEKAYRPFSKQGKEKFVLDFHCPQCQSPYAVGFEWTELHMADTRYFPVHIWSSTE